MEPLSFGNYQDLIQTLRKHLWLWLVPTIAVGLLAGLYSLIADRQWRASQAMIVRADAAGAEDGQIGEFSDLSEMKTLQETILELAKSQSVLRSTLQQAGPPPNYRRPSEWPTATDIAEFRDQIDMRPPGGAEFGKTEVFYISIVDSNRMRAAELVSTLATLLKDRLQALRDERARGMVDELENSVELAEERLSGSIDKLASFEAEIGADLAELRNLNAMVGGQGEISQVVQAVEAELRANETRLREHQQLRSLLTDAQQDPTKLIATPSSLLQSLPALSRLKDALIDAGVRKANLLGSRSETHPLVQAAAAAEQLLKKQLHDELASAIQGVQAEIALCRERDQVLQSRLESAKSRMTRLAGVRAHYSNHVSEVDDHTLLVENARKHLSDVRSRQVGAQTASLIQAIDDVEVGVRPIGPGRLTVTGAGSAAGLLLGLGIVFVVTKPVVGSRNEPEDSIPAVYFSPVSRKSALRPSANTADTAAQPKSRAAVDPKHITTFRGMSLDEALRSIEGRLHNRNGR